MKKLRGIALAAGLCAAVALPSAARAQTVWDLAGIAGTNGSLGTSFTFTNGVFGSVTAFTNSALFSCGFFGFATCQNDVNSQGSGSSLPNPEKGIGISQCGSYGGFFPFCSGGEIGSDNAKLWLNLSGLAPGVTATSLTLASVQSDDKWNVDFTATGGTCSTSTSFAGSPAPSTGTGPTRGTAYVDLPIGAYDCIQFSPGRTGDYLLQSITTEGGVGTPKDVTPEPASMTLLAVGLVGLVSAGRRRRKA